MMLLLHVSKGDILLIGEPLERFSTKRKRSLKSGRCYCTVADFFLSPFDSFVIVVLLARGGSVLTTKVIYSKYYKNYNNEFHGFKPILTQTIHFEAKIEKNIFSVKVNLPKNKKSVRFS